jgi:multisubunit Na+/H+ antiporter MnhF subunit
MTYERLKIASFTHSAIYAVLLVVWIVPGLEPETFVFGLAHGVIYLAMCAACLYALSRRIITLRIAVAVAVLGAIGPFIGSYEFARGTRRGRTAGTALPRADQP